GDSVRGGLHRAVFGGSFGPVVLAARARSRLGLLALVVFASLGFASVAASAATASPVPIVSGVPWYDTSGHPVEAHEGGVVKVGSTYYFIGLDAYNGTNQFNNI